MEWFWGYQCLARVLQTLQGVSLNIPAPSLPEAHGTIPGSSWGIMQAAAFLNNSSCPKTQEYPAGWDQTLQRTM